jgi:hypothetical protein
MQATRQEIGSMAPWKSAVSSPAAVPFEQLVGLVYELVDAHADTEDLAGGLDEDLAWAAHLDYLRDLQRVAREVLAHVC